MGENERIALSTVAVRGERTGNASNVSVKELAYDMSPSKTSFLVLKCIYDDLQDTHHRKPAAAAMSMFRVRRASFEISRK